jgi:heme exporter protein CcmD
MAALPAHIGFVIAAYAVVVAVLVVLVAVLRLEYRRLTRRIGELEARGIRRRSETGGRA